MEYQVTLRYGRSRHRYHTFTVAAEDAPAALREAAAKIPPEIATEVDIVELRPAVDPDRRAYLDEEAVP
jgi:hypothetical protein